MENVENPEQYIAALLNKTKPQHIERTYDIKGFNDSTEFLELLARKGGRLLKGGEADVDGVAKMVLNDFLRGKIPWFTPPPVVAGQEKKGVEGRKGVLGEMGRIKKRDHLSSSFVPETSNPIMTTEESRPEPQELSGFGEGEALESVELSGEGTLNVSDQDGESGAEEGGIALPEDDSAASVGAQDESIGDNSNLLEEPPARSPKRRKKS